MTARTVRARWAPARAGGVTLFEVLIVVALIAVLTAIAAPMYTQYIIRGQRAAAKTALLQMSQAMERYYTSCGTYTTATAGPCFTGTAPVNYPLATPVGGPNCFAVSPGSGSATYCLGPSPATAPTLTSYLLVATPCGDAASGCPASANMAYTDPTCDVLSIDNTGAKGTPNNVALAAQCWQQ
jgi:type IV pilus assembly protein PilE